MGVGNTGRVETTFSVIAFIMLHHLTADARIVAFGFVRGVRQGWSHRRYLCLWRF